MPDILNAAEVRSGTWGELWLDGEQVAECYGCQIKVNKTKEDVQRCRTLVAGKKMTGVAVTGTIRIYNATSRLIKLEAEAIQQGKDLRHTIISNLDDPDNPDNQRISVSGVSFDDLTLADWAEQRGDHEAAKTAYNTVLQREPQNEDAILGLTEVYIAQGNKDAARATLATLPAEQNGEPLSINMQRRLAMA